MKEHSKKMIAPIIVSILIILYIIGYVAILALIDFSWWICLIGGLIGLIFIGVMIGVLISRIKEIRSGEEDDLSNY